MEVKWYNGCVDEWADRLYRFVLKNLKNRDRSRDVVQEVYMRLWINKDQIDRAKVKTWLFTTAYRAMIDEIRRDEKFEEMDMALAQCYPSQPDPSPDLNEVLHEAIERLPAIQKAVLLLRDYEGYTYDEIANICELNESQVKVYIFRARMYLKKYIGNLEVVL